MMQDNNYEQLNANYQKLKNEYKRLAKEYEKVSNDYTYARSENQRWKVSYETLEQNKQSHIDRLTEENSSLDEEVRDLRDEIRALNEELSELRESSRKPRSVYDKLGDVGDIQAQFAKEDLKKMRDGKNMKYQNGGNMDTLRISGGPKPLPRKDPFIPQENRFTSERTYPVRQTDDGSLKKLEKLQKKNEELQSRIDELEVFKSEKERLEREKASLKAQIAKLEKDITDLNDAKMTVEKNNVEFQKVNKEFADRETEYVNALKEKDQQISQIENEKKKAEEEFAEQWKKAKEYNSWLDGEKKKLENELKKAKEDTLSGFKLLKSSDPELSSLNDEEQRYYQSIYRYKEVLDSIENLTFLLVSLDVVSSVILDVAGNYKNALLIMMSNGSILPNPYYFNGIVGNGETMDKFQRISKVFEFNIKFKKDKKYCIAAIRPAISHKNGKRPVLDKIGKIWLQER